MAGIVALRGTDCGCSGLGVAADSSSTAPAVLAPPKMSPLTLGIWIAAIGTVGYIFWATLQPKSRRLVT